MTVSELVVGEMYVSGAEVPPQRVVFLGFDTDGVVIVRWVSAPFHVLHVDPASLAPLRTRFDRDLVGLW